ncbi:stage V sporulation protein AA [Vallitalea longa]|uniref:Stage V sporulation protein AA n=1 Tax=Vallitalea longa TaxID=2936439 RepID=A0A9W6DD22_9FIRM|nr:stage V sporulation protein AA [Vallitalea longa]GKX27991.1 stage V sporulation protein AA [Vallitalea longa]
MDNIYIKASKKVNIIGKKNIIINDIADIEGKKEIVNKIKHINIFTIDNDKKKNYLLSIITIIAEIQKYYENILIQNVGEEDIIISYSPKEKQHKYKNFIRIVKVIFVCITLFTGGGIAIMTFHTDAAVPDVFVRLYSLFLGEENINPLIIEIPYSIGLATGIIVFFNHFSSKKLTDDPTPIEVEMRLYERDVEDCIIENLTDEGNKEK